MSNVSMNLETQYGAFNYAPLPVVLVKGEGVHVWDDQGKKYVDMMSAYSAVSHGHCHPRLVDVLVEQARRLCIVSRAYYTDKLGAFQEALCQKTGFDRALPMNTGSEAVETALKVARKWAYKVKGVPQGKAEIIACSGNFHGRTIAIVGLSTEAQYQDGFGPFPEGLKSVTYGDIDALEAAITPHTAAFLIEPIQGEAGIQVPPEGYLKACEALCKKHNVLLICDEVQCGLGRTGTFLASDHENVKPDGLILGKALGGGMLPISAFLASHEVMGVLTPGDHGSTFGGNPLATAVATEALQALEDEGLIENSKAMGEYFKAKLKEIHHPAIKEVRGKGLFIGVEIDPNFADARDLCLAMMEQGVLSKETHATVIRFAPPLVIQKEHIDHAVEVMEQVLCKVPA